MLHKTYMYIRIWVAKIADYCSTAIILIVFCLLWLLQSHADNTLIRAVAQLGYHVHLAHRITHKNDVDDKLQFLGVVLAINAFSACLPGQGVRLQTADSE